MDIYAWITIVTVLSTFGILMFTKLRSDLVFLGVVGILFVTGVLDVHEALSGFSSTTVAVVGVMFVSVVKMWSKKVKMKPSQFLIPICLAGNVVAILEGSLDTAAARETEKEMNPLNDVEGKDIIIDCTNLEYISSAGLRILLGILQNVEEKGGNLYIKGVNSKVLTIFNITGFSNIFEFI